MTQRMVGLAKLKPEPGIWLTEEAVPKPGPTDVLIRVKRTAICGTDMHIYNWDEWAAKTIPVPMIVGHEFSGEIVEIGRAVTRNLSVGQRVSGEGHLIDIDSEAARAGNFHLDPGTQGVGVDRTGCGLFPVGERVRRALVFSSARTGFFYCCVVHQVGHADVLTVFLYQLVVAELVLRAPWV